MRLRPRAHCEIVGLAMALVEITKHMRRHVDLAPREVPGGTVGGRMPWANIPRSSSCSESFMQAPASPMMSGNIALAGGRVSNPSERSPSDRCRQLSHKTARRSGSRSARSTAAIAMAITAGGKAVVKMKLRQRLINSSRSARLPAT